MLVMEALFGLAGLAAAPIYFADFKNELAARNLIRPTAQEAGPG